MEFLQQILKNQYNRNMDFKTSIGITGMYVNRCFIIKK